MSKKKHHKKHRAMMANPSGGKISKLELLKRVAIATGIVGASGLVSKFGLDWVASKFKNADGSQMLTGYHEGAAKIGAAVALGFASALIEQVPAALGAGISVGGAIGGMEDIVTQYKLDHPATSSASSSSSSAANQPSTHAGAGAFLPAGAAGVPGRNSVQTRAGCAAR